MQVAHHRPGCIRVDLDGTAIAEGSSVAAAFSVQSERQELQRFVAGHVVTTGPVAEKHVGQVQHGGKEVDGLLSVEVAHNVHDSITESRREVPPLARTP